MSVRATRRDVPKLGGAAVASMAVSSWTEAASAASAAAAAPAWKPIPIGTQAWCVRKELATDIPGTLAQVAKAGFQLLELENRFGKSGTEWKAALDAAGLKAAGFHHNLSDLADDKLNATIEFNQGLGNRNLIVRSLPPGTYTSTDLLKKVADDLNAVAQKLAPHKLRVGYHNHTTDFNVLDGESWWNRFADATSKDVVLQFDTGNASEKEGVDVVQVLKRNPGRVRSMHIKPFSKAQPNAILGADELKWPAIMTAAETVAGVELYIIEYEKETGHPPIEDLKANLDAFKKLRS
jgi:sugar phosphate isomerase/epimerase